MLAVSFGIEGASGLLRLINIKIRICNIDYTAVDQQGSRVFGSSGSIGEFGVIIAIALLDLRLILEVRFGVSGFVREFDIVVIITRVNLRDPW